MSFLTVLANEEGTVATECFNRGGFSVATFAC